MVQSLSKILWLTIVFAAVGTFAQKQKAKEKDHYYGTYIGDFQDRFHGVAGQVKHSFFHFKAGLPHSIYTYVFCIVVHFVVMLFDQTKIGNSKMHCSVEHACENGKCKPTSTCNGLFLNDILILCR